MNKLEQIILHKTEELAQRRRQRSLDEVRAAARDASPPRGFVRALTSSSGLALIAEVKRASPSAGPINMEMDPVTQAATLRAAGAHCLSVLTDERFFHGSERFLIDCRERVDCPVLRKDFTTSPYHIYEARAIGADAILLIVACLSDSELRELRELAEELGMDALVEVHDLPEAERAMRTGATLVGVNNRNLRTFEIDLSTTESVLPALAGVTAVSESGLYTRDDVQRVQHAGAKAVLIGTAFSQAPDPAQAVRGVMGW